MTSRLVAHKAWLLPFLRTVESRVAERGGDIPRRLDTSDESLMQALHERGFGRGFPTDVWPGDERPDGPDYQPTDYILLNALLHECELAAELLIGQGIPFDRAHYTLLLLTTLAEAVNDGDGDLSRAAWALHDLEPGRRQTRAANKVAITVGAALRERALDGGSPLLGHPFHQILLYEDALLGARLAVQVGRAVICHHGLIDPLAVMKAQGLAQVGRLQAIDAVIGLAAADHETSGLERDLLDALCDAALLDDLQREVVERSLDAPRSPSSLAAEVRDPTSRASIYRQVALSALLDERQTPSERRYLGALGRAFAMPPDALDHIHLETALHLREHPELREAFSLGGFFHRLCADLWERVEVLVGENLEKIMTEIEQMGELGHLLAQATHRDLSDAEETEVKRQLIDVLKTIPSLTLFAIPGGSLLLPIVIKIMPFDILPTAFSRTESLA